MKESKLSSTVFCLFIFFSIIVISFNQCKKDEVPNDITNTPNLSATSDNSLSESIFNQVSYDIDATLNEQMNAVLSKIKGGENPQPQPPAIKKQPVISLYPFDTISWPKKLDINYGDTNKIGDDNNIRRGKISTSYSGKIQNPGSEITITFDNYYFNNNKIEGTKKIKNKGRNSKHQLVFSETVTDAKITKPDGTVIQWSQTSEKTWITGELTKNNIYDDEYSITGTRSGTDSNGKHYEVKILSPLDIQGGCKWIRKGKINFTIENVPSSILIDYGNGNCDADAILTINNKTINIILD